jgi:hypothetical protein
MPRPRLPLATFLALILLANPGPVAASGSTGNLSLFVGPRVWGGDWVTNGHPLVALELTLGGYAWPLLLDVYASSIHSKKENVFSDEVSEQQHESGVGLTRVWNIRAFHPHLGLGVRHAWARTHIQGEESGDLGFDGEETGG